MLMKLIKKGIIVAILVVLSLGTTSAQDAYGKALGVRGGFLSGVSYKHFLEFAGAIEGIVGFNFENGRIFTVTGLYEHHFFLNYNTNFFVGGGLTLGANSSKFRTIAEVDIGLEYVMPRFPMSVSVDYKPAYNIFGNDFFFNEFALTVRYILD